jgi:hypothetical protein
MTIENSIADPPILQPAIVTMMAILAIAQFWQISLSQQSRALR